MIGKLNHCTVHIGSSYIQAQKAHLTQKARANYEIDLAATVTLLWTRQESKPLPAEILAPPPENPTTEKPEPLGATYLTSTKARTAPGSFLSGWSFGRPVSLCQSILGLSGRYGLKA